MDWSQRRTCEKLYNSSQLRPPSQKLGANDICHTQVFLLTLYIVGGGRYTITCPSSSLWHDLLLGHGALQHFLHPALVLLLELGVVVQGGALREGVGGMEGCCCCWA